MAMGGIFALVFSVAYGRIGLRTARGTSALLGLLAFIGMPEFCTLDYAFWVKMLAILLLGVNTAAFYLTGVFSGIKDLGPGQDAPVSAKLVAASSLFLWFGVILLGRYIQYYQDSIPFGQ